MILVIAYAPCNNTEEEVKDTLWRELERTMADVDPGEKLCVMDDLECINGGQSRRSNR